MLEGFRQVFGGIGRSGDVHILMGGGGTVVAIRFSMPVTARYADHDVLK